MKRLSVGTVLVQRKNNKVESIKVESGSVNVEVKQGIMSISSLGTSPEDVRAWLTGFFESSNYSFRVKESEPARKDGAHQLRIEVRKVA